jgi:hypothetical protein
VESFRKRAVNCTYHRPDGSGIDQAIENAAGVAIEGDAHWIGGDGIGRVTQLVPIPMKLEWV